MLDLSAFLYISFATLGIAGGLTGRSSLRMLLVKFAWSVSSSVKAEVEKVKAELESLKSTGKPKLISPGLQTISAAAHF